MTTTALPPLQLALALDEQPKRSRKVGFVIPPRPFVTVTYPYDEADRARLVRAINRLQWGDSLHSHPYRLERHAADRDENGDEHDEFYILTRNGDPVWKRVISAEKDDALQRCFRDAVEAMSIDLCKRGVTDWFPRPGEVRYCGRGIGVARLESKTDYAESLCETLSENIGYNKADCEVYQQEALVVAQRSVRDSDSVYLFSKNMPLDSTIPLTLADAVLRRHMTYQGCYSVKRDLLLHYDILDPRGDKAYAIEMKYGRPVPMTRCTSILHRGRRDLPSTEFVEGSTVCRSCQGIIDHRKRGTSTAAETRKNTWKRMRGGKLGKGGHYLAA